MWITFFFSQYTIWNWHCENVSTRLRDWFNIQDFLHLCMKCFGVITVTRLAPNSIQLHMAMVTWWAATSSGFFFPSFSFQLQFLLRTTITFVEISKLQIGFHGRKKKECKNRCDYIIRDKLEANKYKRKFNWKLQMSLLKKRSLIIIAFTHSIVWSLASSHVCVASEWFINISSAYDGFNLKKIKKTKSSAKNT